jgi:hypothetical protein
MSCFFVHFICIDVCLFSVLNQAKVLLADLSGQSLQTATRSKLARLKDRLCGLAHDIQTGRLLYGYVVLVLSGGLYHGHLASYFSNLLCLSLGCPVETIWTRTLSPLLTSSTHTPFYQPFCKQKVYIRTTPAHANKRHPQLDTQPPQQCHPMLGHPRDPGKGRRPVHPRVPISGMALCRHHISWLQLQWPPWQNSRLCLSVQSWPG